MRYLVSLILAFSIIFSGTVLAHDSRLVNPGTLPDSPFYFFERIFESVGSLFTFGAKAKAERALRLAEERLAEAEALADKGKHSLAEKAVRRYNETRQKAEDLLNAVKVPKIRFSIAKKAIEAAEKHIEVLEEIVKKVPDEAKEGLEHAIEVSRRGRDRIEKVFEDLNFEVEEEVGFDVEEKVSEQEKTAEKKIQSEIPIEAEEELEIIEGGPELQKELESILEKSNDLMKAADTGLEPAPEFAPNEVPAQESAAIKEIKEFIVVASDDLLDPASVEVNKGDEVRITFRVQSPVYFGGLEFKGLPYFKTGTLHAGEEETVSFIAEESFEYGSYWPQSDVIKQFGSVIVKE